MSEDGCETIITGFIGLVVVSLIGLCLYLIVDLLTPDPRIPPEMNAPLMDVIHWCDQESKHTKMVGKLITAYYVPEEFTACLNGYEYQLEGVRSE